MASRKAGLMLAAMTLIAGSSCKKTVEGERASWERNTQQVRTLATLYPAFAKAIDQQLASAQQMMDAAGSSAEKDRPGRMAEANRKLNGGFVADLRRLDGAIAALRTKVTTAAADAKDETGRQSAKQAAADADRVLASVDEAVKRGAADAASATAVMSRVMGELNSADKNVEIVLAAQRKAAQAAKEQAAAKPSGPASQQPVQSAAPKSWKCAYCGSVNEASVGQCKSCGAPAGG